VIFDEIVLHNFGLYRGRHTILLTPPSPDKPVVLIGGLNGGGKTTFLDAIQLGLYGKRARSSNRGNLSYEEYLKRSVHRGVSQAEGAAIEVQFRQRIEGGEHSYRVHRSWTATPRGVTERTEVLRDGAYDQVLTDGWGEVVEEFIPVSMSHLFFFDGEKIEAFADIENSTQLLSKAIYSLLGLDLVDRLSHDLTVLDNRQRATIKNDVERKQLDDAEQDVQRLEAIRKETTDLRASKQNQLDRLEKRLSEIETQYENEGGVLFDNKKGLEEERLKVEGELRKIEDRLREIAAGAAPLLLIFDLLASVASQNEREQSAEQARGLDHVLRQRDGELLEGARAHSASKKVLAFLEEFLSKDRAQRSDEALAESYLHLSSEGSEAIQHLVKAPTLQAIYEESRQLIQTAEELQSRRYDFDRKLAGVPDRERLTKIIEELKATQTALQEERVNLAALDMEIARITRERDQKKSRWLAQAEQVLGKQLEQSDVHRILSHSQRVKGTLQKFRTAVVERHVNRIEQLVLDSFRQLLRKKSLISGLRIDPVRFSLELIGSDGQPISPDRLSAGERQLLAVSMLWGLARASGRPLPTIIDTPLGRLDAAHRINLIERYFPYASHQVLLLSTDEEIDEGYYRKLKPWVGHAYNLDFDDTLGETSVRPGYFW
jgi:DNA sulfur modification protein DndD